MSELQKILDQYGVKESEMPFGNGHINNTYVVGDLVVQRINTDVFHDYKGVMDNILAVTDFLRQKISAEGGDPERETLTVVPTIDGRNYVVEDEGVFRAYRRILNATSHDFASYDLLREAGKGFGHFQTLLSDFPVDQLNETIPDFHDTRKRFDALCSAIHMDICGRVESVKEEIGFALSRKEDVGVIMNALSDGSIPYRVTHNDTKLNNVLLDDVTGKAVCVLDLDTVMPGSLLFDFGDALRFGASTAAEDEQDLTKVDFDLSAFRAFSEGFLQEIGSDITDQEIQLLPFSVKLLTLECGMRFLTDYLQGDTYFKTSRPGQNLDRCRTQFRLVEKIEENLPVMGEIISEICSEMSVRTL